MELPPDDIRDPNDNGVAVTKLQYQHEFTPSAYLRVYGYMLYSNWYINGSNSAAQPYYGAELPNTRFRIIPTASNLSYTNQLSAQNLLTRDRRVYRDSNLQRYYVGYIHPNYGIRTSSVTNGKCYDPTAGCRVGCYDQTQGTIAERSGRLGNANPALPARARGAIRNGS